MAGHKRLGNRLVGIVLLAVWCGATSTETLKQTGLERLAYKLTLDAKKSVAESNEDNNENCVPAYVIR
jgi:hypothetical protein